MRFRADRSAPDAREHIVPGPKNTGISSERPRMGTKSTAGTERRRNLRRAGRAVEGADGLGVGVRHHSRFLRTKHCKYVEISSCGEEKGIEEDMCEKMEMAHAPPSWDRPEFESYEKYARDSCTEI